MEQVRNGNCGFLVNFSRFLNERSNAMKKVMLMKKIWSNVVIGILIGLLTHTVASASVITASAAWGGSDYENLYEEGTSPSGVNAILQSFVVPDPGPGLTTMAESLTLTARAAYPDTVNGYEFWIIPGDYPDHLQPYIDKTGSAIGHGSYVGAPLSPTFTERDVSFDSSFSIAPGTYYIEIHVLNLGATGQPGQFARGDNLYADGMQAGTDDTGLIKRRNNGTKDLVFSLNGTVVPEPATMALLLMGIVGLIRRK